MKKSIWIFLLAVLLPAVGLGWLALRSAEEQKIIFERRTAELYQKETEALGGAVREAVEDERRAFGDTVHLLLANGNPEALARDFPNTLADAWQRKATGFTLDKDGKLMAPTPSTAASNPEWRRFLIGNGGFVGSSESALVYTVQAESKLAQASSNLRPRALAGYGQSWKGEDGKAKADRPGANEAPEKPEGTGLAMTVPPVGSPKYSHAYAGKSAENFDGSREESLRDEDLTGRRKREQAGADAERLKQVAEPSAPLAAGLKSTGAEPAKAPRPTAPGPAAPAPAPQVAEMKKPRSEKTAAGAGSPDQIPFPKDAPAPDVAAAKEGPPPPAEGNVGNLAKAAGIPDATPKGGVRSRYSGDSASQEAKAQGTLESAIGQAAQIQINRQVEPQQLLGAPSVAWSNLTPANAEFRAITEQSDGGIVSRFVQDKLELIFWLRPPEAPEMIFGCLIEVASLGDLWKEVMTRHSSARPGRQEESVGQPDYVMAVLDDRARPAATQPPSTVARDWKRPFVASEIGEVLPHWEAALYLASPTALADSARGLWRTLAFTIAGAVALIALGGWLVVADVRRQLALAQQKTDFVSNVSHELKTPLTSIRMFAELMHDRPQPAEKQGRYLRIITVEAERLTRLINNVLDFARIGRKQKRFEKKPLDLHTVVSHVWESQGLHLREAGFETRWEAAPGPYPVLGDDDALSQVLVNLLSNAEKYSTGRKEVELHTWVDDGWVNVSVLDRGMGVPNGEERKIFEAFYRAHDSLNSGIQGSGLGLTLAHHVATEHGGAIWFEPREGGGSRFTLRIPLMKPSDS